MTRPNREEERARLFDLSLEAMFVADFDGRLRLVNRALERLLGYTQEDVVGRPFVELVHVDDRVLAEAALAKATHDDVRGFECRSDRSDGSLRWLDWSMQARPEEGSVYGVGRDVTDSRMQSDTLDALRRLAPVEPQRLFAAVAQEVAQLIDVPFVSVLQFDVAGMATECAAFAPGRPPPALAEQWRQEGGEVLRLARETFEKTHVDDHSLLEAEIAAVVRRASIHSTIGLPIVADGRLWGVMVVSGAEQRVPAWTHGLLTDFTDLLATAIESTAARVALERLAEEQAALRRVATLVATSTAPAEIFEAVSQEVARLHGSNLAAVTRFDPDAEAYVVMGVAQEVPNFRVGSRWELREGMTSTQVYRTGRSARIDAAGWAAMTAPIGKVARDLDVDSTVVIPINVEGRLWGTITLSAKEPLPVDTEKRLERFSDLVATAIANAESRQELTASRRRIVAAADNARRTIERDLHDGMQQRLVSLALAAQTAKLNVPEEHAEIRAELARIASELSDAVEDLQTISRGIHPAILSDAGLGPALNALARRSAIPVQLDVTTAARFPAPVEIATYFVASEAFANAAKHSQASHIKVSLVLYDQQLILAISDDGVGGAEFGRGSGLVGLQDRVEALEGTMTIESAPGNGTSLTIALPIDDHRVET